MPQFRDPIHGFISISEDEQKIVDSAPFQRLRNIRQLATTYLVYHGAEHTRFGHSIGVIHLVSRVFDSVVAKRPNLFRPDQKENQAVVMWYRQILRLIALTHDLEVIGAAEGMKEDKESWKSFFLWLKNRGLDGVKLVIGDKCQGMLEAVYEVYSQAKYQRCVVHFYRNVFSVTPRGKMKQVAKMLKAVHAQESKKAASEKAKLVIQELREMKLPEAAKKVEDSIEKTLTYMAFPSEYWVKIRTNNVLERLNREICRRTRVVGAFPDGNSALMLVCARLRHVAGTQWGNKKYISMKHLQ